MMRFFTSVFAALRAVFAVLLALVLLPGRFLRALFGVAQDHDEIPLIAPAEDLEKVAEAEVSASGPDHLAAAVVLGWCAQSIIDGRPALLPLDAPMGISRWLRGLTRQECEVIVNSEPADIESHLRGRHPLPGVRGVRPLMPQPWTAGSNTGPAADLSADEESPEPAMPSTRP